MSAPRPDGVRQPTVARESETILRVDRLSVEYGRRSPIPAIREVSLEVARHEAIGVVGESGSGKSTLAAALTGLFAGSGRVIAGSIRLQDRELVGIGEREWRTVRGRRVGMVFQEAATALDPLMTVGGHLTEALRVTRRLTGRTATEAALALLREVGLSDPERRVRQYPHELSGGMRQRVQIAIALAGDPLVLVADEPTTALDVTIQAQILALLRARQRERGMALLLISHSLPVVASVVDRVVVMYGGRVMESGPARALFDSPRHPYTAALIAANLHVERDSAIRPIPGVPVRVDRLPDGCPFEPRCAHAVDSCHRAPPPPPHRVESERLLACPVDPLASR